MRQIHAVLLFGLGVAVAACGSSVDDDDGRTDDGTADDGAGGGGAAGGAGAEAGDGGTAGNGAGGVQGPDVFACVTTPDCVQEFGHLGEAITAEARRCGGELAVAGSGAILQTWTPGPYPSDWHTLVVLLGDGTLLQQTRGRCQQAGACADLYGTDWELQTPLEHCDAVIEAKAIAGCDVPDGACAWSGQSSNCVVVPEPWDCSALEQAR